jgi:ankyrin repeat protein
MPKLHDKIYYAIIWRLNGLALKWIDQNRATIDQGLYRGAVQLLHHAVKFRNYGFAKRLLERGVHIDCRNALGTTALQDAAQRGDLSGMKWLIQHGADFDRQKDELLLAAVRCAHPKIITWLIDRGCDVNATTAHGGQHPLQHCDEYCSDKDRGRIVALLERHGARIPEKNEQVKPD